MLDAMSIRQMEIYDQKTKTMLGYCDLGHGPEEDGPLASEVLVFLVTGLKSSWKAPVAYFFTKGLSAATQRELLLHTVHTLKQHGFSVQCITMDGHASNLGMCQSLGARMKLTEDVSPYFFLDKEFGGDRIFILLDPCHMIKLVRNLLNALGSIKSTDGLVEWRFIRDLHNLQDSEGLRLGNKLTARHISFHHNKMKVCGIF